MEWKTKYENVMIIASENEKKSQMQHTNSCPMQNRETFDSKLQRNWRDKSLTFIVMCFLKSVNNTLYWFLGYSKFLRKPTNVFWA